MGQLSLQLGFGECQRNCSRSVWKLPNGNIPGLLCLTRWDRAKELRVLPPTTGDTSSQEREGWEYQEILLQSPQQRCLTSNGSREASSVWWSWPADTKCPCGVEKTPAGTSPGAAQHGRAMAGGSWVSLRSQGPLTPKVLTAGWVREEMKHFLFTGEPSETSAGGQVELLLPHRAASSQEPTVLRVPDAALSTSLGQGQRNPCAGLSCCGWLSPESRGGALPLTLPTPSSLCAVPSLTPQATSSHSRASLSSRWRQ